MVVADQHLPLLPLARDTVSDDFASAFEPSSRASPPKDIGPSIDRIGQQPVNRIVARRAPLHGPPLATIDGNRQVDPLLPQPQGELAHAADLAELAKHQRQRLTDSAGRGPVPGDHQRCAGNRSRPSYTDRRAPLLGATPLVNAAGKLTTLAR